MYPATKLSEISSFFTSGHEQKGIFESADRHIARGALPSQHAVTLEDERVAQIRQTVTEHPGMTLAKYSNSVRSAHILLESCYEALRKTSDDGE